jgi:ABC-2 type transport system permease protein
MPVFVITTVLSGGLFPLDVFGEGLMALFRFMPFQYIIYFPLSIVVGNATANEIVFGVLVQVIWLVLLYGISKIVWRAGMKRYIAAGG